MIRPTVLALGACALLACSFDEAALHEPGSGQIAADLGELRVLSHHDDPADDRWVDVVTPDPAVLDEGDAFRQADSRTADDDEPADLRRLFTGVGPGRTLLVTVDCRPCDGGEDDLDSEILVWDFAVGGVDEGFSAGTRVARPDETNEVDVGDFLVVVRDGPAGPASDIAFAFPEGGRIQQVAAHTPDDGADLWVDVYLATEPGSGSLSLTDATGPAEYAVVVT